jgi:hypothetical protein
MSSTRNGTQDETDVVVEHIRKTLTVYERSHPRAAVAVRRLNSVAVGIRVIDPDFEGRDYLEREPEIWEILHTLPEEIFVNIALLFLYTPEEAEHSLANYYEFEHPDPSPV